MSQLLFTAFSNRADAVHLAHEAGRQLQEDGVSSSLHLLDVDATPDVDATTLVVSLGGDGTFLKSARLAHAGGARVLAVNLGRLGFLLNVPSDAVVADAKSALSGDDVVDRLALLISVAETGLEEFALNEVVVERAHAGHMVRLKTFVDEDEYLTYSADGVMVSRRRAARGTTSRPGDRWSRRRCP